MTEIPLALRFLLLIVSGRGNRQQQEIIEYLRTENSVPRASLKDFTDHYHRERPHQGLGNRLIDPLSQGVGAGPVRCRERLGGTLRFYYRDAA
jgi:transposase InsO family protein